MTPTLLRIISACSAVTYSAAFALYVIKTQDKRVKLVSEILKYCALALNLAIVINNYAVNGYVPFVSMYQVLTFLAAAFSLVYVYMRFVHNGRFMKPYFLALPAVLMVGVTCMDQSSEWAFPPALQSAYFVPHVFSYMISYTLTAVAALMCVINIFKKDERYPSGIYSTVITAYPFMLCGMLLGALWANACWGEYWQWDPKENWSLITILSLTVYLHFIRQEKLKKYAPVFVIASAVFMIITLFFVGMFGGSSNHTYS